MTNTIHIDAGSGYDVLIGRDLLAQVGERTRRALPKTARIAVFTDTTVQPLYGDAVERSLREAGFETCCFVFPAGERSKNLATVGRFLDFMSEHRLTRRDAVLVLGGGVAGDMGGFAASIYLRGIPFVQVPTTLLAAVDSSVGGKTGIDTAYGKNLTGTFWQPSLVVCDTGTFDSLGVDQVLDGTAEIIKTASIRDADLFERLEAGALKADPEAVIARCVEIKGEVVASDEKESGLRRILNFGHTLGHAIELKKDYGISHGRAVAIGMLLVTAATRKNGWTESGIYERLLSLISSSGFAVETDVPLEDLCEAARSDKKSEGDSIHIIYLQTIGSCADRTVRFDALYDFLKSE